MTTVQKHGHKEPTSDISKLEPRLITESNPLPRYKSQPPRLHQPIESPQLNSKKSHQPGSPRKLVQPPPSNIPAPKFPSPSPHRIANLSSSQLAQSFPHKSTKTRAKEPNEDHLDPGRPRKRIRRENDSPQSGMNAQTRHTMFFEVKNCPNEYIGYDPYAISNHTQGKEAPKSQDESDAESNISEHVEKLTKDEVQLFPSIWR